MILLSIIMASGTKFLTVPYAFAGASIRFIRQSGSDHSPRQVFHVENYRSTGHIIAVANAAIEPAPDRIKAGHAITIDRKLSKQPAGGDIASLDPVGQGRVQLLNCPSSDLAQAIAAVDELVRLSCLDPEWDWSRTAIISRLGVDSLLCEPMRKRFPVEMANESLPSIWRLREMQR